MPIAAALNSVKGQQRLLCDANVSKKHLAECPRPFMMIHDVGQTFGRANLFDRKSVGSVNFDAWANTPIWRDVKQCQGNLAPSEIGTLSDPYISEGGRRLLSNLLRQLTDRQLTDLFSGRTRFVARLGMSWRHPRDVIHGGRAP